MTAGCDNQADGRVLSLPAFCSVWDWPHFCWPVLWCEAAWYKPARCRRLPFNCTTGWKLANAEFWAWLQFWWSDRCAIWGLLCLQSGILLNHRVAISGWSVIETCWLNSQDMIFHQHLHVTRAWRSWLCPKHGLLYYIVPFLDCGMRTASRSMRTSDNANALQNFEVSSPWSIWWGHSFVRSKFVQTSPTQVYMPVIDGRELAIGDTLHFYNLKTLASDGSARVASIVANNNPDISLAFSNALNQELLLNLTTQLNLVTLDRPVELTSLTDFVDIEEVNLERC